MIKDKGLRCSRYLQIDSSYPPSPPPPPSVPRSRRLEGLVKLLIEITHLIEVTLVFPQVSRDVHGDLFRVEGSIARKASRFVIRSFLLSYSKPSFDNNKFLRVVAIIYLVMMNSRGN